MAAGLGFKTFTTGEVLTAADTNGYLMQGILVFASAAARDAAITSPQEGQFAYLKDTNVTTYYTGSAWANVDTTGMTNPMTTTGDMIYSSSGSTPARLGIGSTGQVMTVAAGIPSWATPSAGGGKVLQVVNVNTTTNVTTTSTSFQNSGLSVSITPSLNTSKVMILTTGNWDKAAGNATTYPVFEIIRGATQITTEDGAGYTGASNIQQGFLAMNFLDSPATTSATTYNLRFKSSVSGQTVGMFNPTSTGTMLLLEIGA